MTPHDRGLFTVSATDINEGQRYSFRLANGKEYADPCSLWQPDGVPGPSAVFFPERFQWTDQAWKGIAQSDLVFYELHIGTFTHEGRFDAVVPRLPQLRELGITAIEIMPVGQFPGTRNWGYDGVLPYAAQHNYGGPPGLLRLVNAAHKAGLAVFLDVVYNHFGPEHNYLDQFGPYLTDKYKTPWGKGVNYDDAGCDGVRDYIVHNARMWLEEFHLDGLRLDAVHAIYDFSPKHILQEIKEVADEAAARSGRAIHIVAESDLNDPRIIRPAERGGYGLDAQWSDDFHHAVHAYLAGEERGYYRDYGRREHLAQALAEPFVYAGQYSAHRGRSHGASAAGIPGNRFVVCIQNHDQVGNRAKGDRFSTLVDSPAKLRLAACLMLLSPHLPLLFMGEEYGETNPFPFVCSFCGEELIKAVREGRKREFSDFVMSGEEIPDPASVETFKSAILSWSWPENSRRAKIRQLYKNLLSLRRTMPALRDFENWSAHLLPEQPQVLELIRGGRSSADAGGLRVLFNVSSDSPTIGAQPVPVRFSSESVVYGGARAEEASVATLLPFECVIAAST